jgi:outer membrane protein assembly factor BamA
LKPQLLYTLRSCGAILLIFLVAAIAKEKKYEVAGIEFQYRGEGTFDDNTLLRILETPKNQYYRQEILAMDLKRLRKFFFDNGFFNAAFDTSVTLDDEDEEAEIIIRIDEKERFRIRSIEFKGLENVPDAILKQIDQDRIVHSESDYVKSRITDEETRIVGILQNNGYLYAAVDSTEGTIVQQYPASDAKNKNRVNLIITFIGADKQYYFGKTKIDIDKNVYGIEEKIIRRELEFKEGELYRKDNVSQSERNFSKLAIVQSGRIQIDTVLDEQRRINTVVKITLNKKNEIIPNIKAVDINGEFHVGAGVQYVDKNFLGGGRVFTAELSALAHSKDVHRIETSFTLFQPYLFNNDITATLNSKFNIINNEDIQTYSLANLLRLNYFIASYTFYQNVYSDFTFDLLRQKYKVETPVDGDTAAAGTLSNLINQIFGLTLVHDNTNSLFWPSGGFYHSITVENAGIIPRVISFVNPNVQFSQYVKFYIPNRFYFDISRNETSIIASKFIFGDIVEYGGGDEIVPVASIYKFFSGGSTSLRGWAAKTAGILTNPQLGGKFLIDGSEEYRWKLFPTSPGFMQNFWLVFFLDWGNVWESGKFFRFNEIALATGPGIRYDTFAGPLRVDFGFKLYDPRAPAGEQWLFSGGNIFKDKFTLQIGLGNAF